MAWPAIATLGATALGGLFSGRRTRQPDLMQIMAEMMPFIQGQLAPGRTAMMNAALSRGQALGQDIGGAIGRIGAASTGPGRIAMSLGQSLSSGLMGEAEMSYRNSLMQALMQLAPMQAGLKAGERSGTENLMSYLAQAFSGGALSGPLGSLFGGGGGGTSTTPKLPGGKGGRTF